MRKSKLEGEGVEKKKKRRDKKTRAAKAWTLSMFVVACCGCFLLNISIMITAGFIRVALVTTNGVIETFESHV